MAVVQDVYTRRSLLLSGSASCEGVTRGYLAAIRARAELNAFRSVDEEGAIARARAVDAKLSAGEAGALAGMVVALKDNISRSGQPLECCSRMLEGYVAPYDATVVRRLEAADAVIIGTTNMDEFAMGSSTEHSAYGITRHPLDPERVPGGSSGGATAAVAARLADAALGSDTGGSIRQPAAFCGVVGLKPTYGRVSRYGLVAFASTLDQIGPVTTTVRDAALILGVIAGHDPADATSSSEPVPSYVDMLTGEVAGVRIGLPKEYFTDDLEPAVRDAVLAAVSALRERGAIVEDITLPKAQDMVATYHAVSTAEAATNLGRFDGARYGRRAAAPETIDDLTFRSRSEGLGPEVKRRILLGTYLLRDQGVMYAKARQVRRLVTEGMARALCGVDCIVTPTTTTTAFRAGARSESPLAMYLSDAFTVAASLAGLPAVSVPCGRNSSGLPIGLQVIGPAFGEGLMLRVAECVERL